MPNKLHRLNDEPKLTSVRKRSTLIARHLLTDHFGFVGGHLLQTFYFTFVRNGGIAKNQNKLFMFSPSVFPELLEGNKAMYKPCSKFFGKFEAKKAVFLCNDGLGHPGQFVYIRDEREEQEYFGLCEVEVFQLKSKFQWPQRPQWPQQHLCLYGLNSLCGLIGFCVCSIMMPIYSISSVSKGI